MESTYPLCQERAGHGKSPWAELEIHSDPSALMENSHGNTKLTANISQSQPFFLPLKLLFTGEKKGFFVSQKLHTSLCRRPVPGGVKCKPFVHRIQQSQGLPRSVQITRLPTPGNRLPLPLSALQTTGGNREMTRTGALALR